MKTLNDKEKLLEELEKNPVVLIACRRLNISRATFYRWCREDTGFRKKAKDAIQLGSLAVDDMAESVIIHGIKNKNLNASKFWLQHNHPKYKKKKDEEGIAEEELKIQMRAVLEAVKRTRENGGDINKAIQSIDPEDPNDQDISP